MYCFFPLCVETNHIYNKEIEEFPVFMQVYLCLMSEVLHDPLLMGELKGFNQREAPLDIYVNNSLTYNLRRLHA